MSTLYELRQEMSSVSLQIADLLLKRRALAERVIAKKLELQQDIWDPQREQELLSLITAGCSAQEREYLTEVFQTVFVCTRGPQQGEASI